MRATWWEEEDAVNLYHLPGGVFAELYYNTHTNEITWVRAFTSVVPLAEYTAYILLPKDG